MSLTAELKVANPAEAQAGWERVGTKPSDLAAWFTKVFKIEITGEESENPVFVSSSEPENSQDKEKPFFNTSSPFGIGIPINGGESYVYIYPYPPYVPLLYTGGDDKKPSYLRRLSPTELGKFGLTNPEDSSYYYVIFEP